MCLLRLGGVIGIIAFGKVFRLFWLHGRLQMSEGIGAGGEDSEGGHRDHLAIVIVAECGHREAAPPERRPTGGRRGGRHRRLRQ